MTLSRETELGTISVSDVLFAQIIAESFELEPCRDRVWPATRKGRQIGNDQKFSIGEFASHIEVESSFDGESVDLEFSVIVKFGTSIRALTDAMADYIAEEIERKSGKKPCQITVRISGVKSRQTARRSLEVIKRYGEKDGAEGQN